MIASTLRKDKDLSLFAYWSANPWIISLSEEVMIWSTDKSNFSDIVAYAKRCWIDWALIWPDNPIGDWLADALFSAGIRSFAPNQRLAQLESSKWFTRNLMKKYEINWNPDFRVFEGWAENKDDITRYLKDLGSEFVIKYDSLYWWKWVKLSGEHLKTQDDWLEYAMFCLEKCWRVVIEEKLVWEEFSLMFFSDGNTIVPMVPVQDHKRAYDWDVWPNTWWMWSYSHQDWVLPFLDKKDLVQAESITYDVMKALEQEIWSKYIGVMYWGFIATKSWVKLIEYNARFWDPEVMNALTLLKTDLSHICESAICGRLAGVKIEFEPRATVCKYLVANWYPDSSTAWKPVNLNLDKQSKDLNIYFGSITKNEDWQFIMWASRVASFVASWNTIEEARKIVDDWLSIVQWDVFYRRDIGSIELIQKRIDHMKLIRWE